MKDLDIEFEPIVRFASCGNEIQRCKTVYNNVGIVWETFFPWNFFKRPIDSFTVDVIVSNDSAIDNGYINSNLYTEDGYGYPVFDKIEDAISYIDKI